MAVYVLPPTIVALTWTRMPMRISDRRSEVPPLRMVVVPVTFTTTEPRRWSKIVSVLPPTAETSPSISSTVLPWGGGVPGAFPRRDTRTVDFLRIEAVTATVAPAVVAMAPRALKSARENSNSGFPEGTFARVKSPAPSVTEDWPVWTTRTVTPLRLDP